MFRTGFKKERPIIQNGGFQSGPSRGKQRILELKITNNVFFFLNKGLFDLARAEKRNKELYEYVHEEVNIFGKLTTYPT